MNPLVPTAQASPRTPVLNVAAYQFAALDDLAGLRQELKERCVRAGLKGTILLSGEGINLFIAGATESVEGLIEHLRTIPGLEGLQVKESWTEGQPFQRMLVKIKKEIIAFGIDEIRPAVRTSPKLPPQQLRQWLAEGKRLTLLDTRNDYEIELGTFRGAIDLKIKHFRHFPEAAARISDEVKRQPVVMFCTGGIRCEKAGPFMEGLGFQEVYQLEGGILKYFEECGGDHYDGDCFVFDQRVAVGPDLQPTGTAQCFACQHPLAPEELTRPEYVVGESCPYCYQTPQQRNEQKRAMRQSLLIELAKRLPGCVPHDNVRAMHVPRNLAGLPLIEFLVRFHPGIDRESWCQWVRSGAIRFRGRPLGESDVVGEGERIDHHEGLVTEPAVATDLILVHEDEAIVVIDKPAPLPVHPSGRYHLNTLAHFLDEAYRPEKLRMAHRLDANTSGLIVWSRKYSVARKVQSQFAARSVAKRYVALVHGHPSGDEFASDAPIGRDPGELGGRHFDADDGLDARTEFRVLERRDDGTTLLEARPITGRTNQIRIHLWKFNLAIVGDPLYLPRQSIGMQATLDVDSPPMCLHAIGLQLDHPETGERLSFESTRPLAWFGDWRPEPASGS
jgi:RluA family pseudouridine synthase